MTDMRYRIFSLICFGFILFTMLPTIYELYHRNKLPEIRAFELVHNYYTDYNFYLSRIRQGIEGRWTVLEKYTSEPHEGSFIHVMYLAMGWVGWWVRVPWERGGDAYHMARIALGMTLLVLFAEYSRKAFRDARGDKNFLDPLLADTSVNQTKSPKTRVSPPSFLELGKRSVKILSPLTIAHNLQKNLPSLFFWQLLALLLAVTASSWPKLELVDGAYRFGGYMPWWSVMDSLQRISFIPHLLAGQALLVFLMMALSDGTVLRKPGNWIFLGILGFIMGIVFPPGVVFLYTSLAILIVFEVIVDFSRMKRSDRKRFLISRIVSRGVFVLVSIPSFLYLNLMLSFYPWKRLAEFDIVHPLPFTYVEYIKALGPMLPLGIIGLLIAIARKERAMRASIVWVITWILLLIVFRFIPQQSPLRFSEMLPHLPLGVLTAYLFYILMSRFRSGKNFLDPLLAGHVHKSVSVLKDYVSGGSDLELGKRSSKILARAAAHENGLSVSIQFVIRNLSFVIPIFLVALGLFHMYSSYLWQKDFVDHKMRAAWPLVPYGTYVMYPLKDFLTAIRFIQDSTSRDTVVLSEVTAGNYIPVYSGNTVYIGHDNAVNHEVKKEAVAAFFRGSITPTDAAVWMERERLDVVFFGPQEQEEAGLADLSQRYSFLNEVYKNDYVRIYRR